MCKLVRNSVKSKREIRGRGKERKGKKHERNEKEDEKEDKMKGKECTVRTKRDWWLDSNTTHKYFIP